MIAKNLDLMRGGNKRFQKTAAYGHFGRDDPDFTWEQARARSRRAIPMGVGNFGRHAWMWRVAHVLRRSKAGVATGQGPQPPTS